MAECGCRGRPSSFRYRRPKAAGCMIPLALRNCRGRTSARCRGETPCITALAKEREREWEPGCHPGDLVGGLRPPAEVFGGALEDRAKTSFCVRHPWGPPAVTRREPGGGTQGDPVEPGRTSWARCSRGTRSPRPSHLFPEDDEGG